MFSSPDVYDGVVYVSSDDGKLYAFDAAGNTNCSGTPKICAPLWTAIAAGGESSPTVVNGIVYIGSGRRQALRVRCRREHQLLGDARKFALRCGPPPPATPSSPHRRWPTASSTSRPSTASSTRSMPPGTPTAPGRRRSALRCGPQPPTASCGASPAVANGVVYRGLEGPASSMRSTPPGTPTARGHRRRVPRCGPATTGGGIASSPAVANGTVYIGYGDHKLYAFDATGVTNCSGTPVSCAPLWTATTGCGGGLVAGGGQRSGLRGFVRRHALCLRRHRQHRLFGNTEDVCSGVDRNHRRPDTLVANSGQRHGVRGIFRLQLLCVRSPQLSHQLAEPASST